MTRKGVDFVPRGANYVQSTAGADRALDPGWFDGAAMNTAFSDLAARGYNTVRIFLDSCQCSSTRSWLDRAHPGEDEILYERRPATIPRRVAGRVGDSGRRVDRLTRRLRSGG